MSQLILVSNRLSNAQQRRDGIGVVAPGFPQRCVERA
jgi:hypothetical protein